VGFEQVNELMVRVPLSGAPVYARKGAMIAYKGSVRFKGLLLGPGGLAQAAMGAAMRSLTSEQIALMEAVGSGEVLYAWNGYHVSIVELQGRPLYVEAANLLAYTGNIDARVMFLGSQGVSGLIRGATAGQGLFTTCLQGHGEAVLLSDGNLQAFDLRPDRPLSVDPQAYVAHLGDLSTSFKTDVGWRNLVGQSSGESYQMRFSGAGKVFIQASERA